MQPKQMMWQLQYLWCLSAFPQTGDQSQVSFDNEISINARANSLKYLNNSSSYLFIVIIIIHHIGCSPNRYHVNYYFVLPLLRLDKCCNTSGQLLISNLSWITCELFLIHMLLQHLTLMEFCFDLNLCLLEFTRSAFVKDWATLNTKTGLEET